MKIIKKKDAQEEMVGFGLIIIIVAVIGLVFLWFYITKPAEQNLKDYEAENFVQTVLQYTTDCKEAGRSYLNLKDLISWCSDPLKQCENGNSCAILNNTLKGILNESWDAGTEKRIKGYSLNISLTASDGTLETSIYSRTAGNLTGNSRGYSDKYPNKRKWIDVTFSIYS
jgi:hypothetical protein